MHTWGAYVRPLGNSVRRETDDADRDERILEETGEPQISHTLTVGDDIDELGFTVV